MTSIPIIDFIEARLVEDEAAALAVTETVDYALERVWSAALDAKAMMEEPDATEEHYLNKQRHHFARAKAAIAVGDPARVLREVASKRAILETVLPCPTCLEGSRCVPHDASAGAPTWRPATDRDERALKLLATVYSDHPDFDPNWSTT